MIALLLIQASLLARPLYLEEQPPELRSVRALVVLDATSEQAGGSGLPPEEALQLARQLRGRALAGEDFEQLARTYSNAPSARQGGVLGSFAQGMLAEPLDAYLFTAELDAISDPIAFGGAVYLLQRIETHAAVRQIQIAGTGAESEDKARELLAELRAGADFGELAREHSVDRGSAERGGDYAIFERGPRDALLKAAAFQARIGDLVGPVRTVFGFHILQRVPLDEVDPSLREDHFIRARVILISHMQAVGAPETLGRTLAEAQELAADLHARVLAGEDMAELAREYDEDPGGRERAGDLGWVYRYNPDLPRFLDQAFLLPAGELAPIVRSTAGFVILRRER